MPHVLAWMGDNKCDDTTVDDVLGGATLIFKLIRDLPSIFGYACGKDEGVFDESSRNRLLFHQFLRGGGCDR